MLPKLFRRPSALGAVGNGLLVFNSGRQSSLIVLIADFAIDDAIWEMLDADLLDTFNRTGRTYPLFRSLAACRYTTVSRFAVGLQNNADANIPSSNLMVRCSLCLFQRLFSLHVPSLR